MDYDMTISSHLPEKFTMEISKLTNREIEVVLLLSDGLNSMDIAKKLFISRHTVKTHCKNIYQKLGVHSKSQIIIGLRAKTRKI